MIPSTRTESPHQERNRKRQCQTARHRNRRHKHRHPKNQQGPPSEFVAQQKGASCPGKQKPDRRTQNRHPDIGKRNTGKSDTEKEFPDTTDQRRSKKPSHCLARSHSRSGSDQRHIDSKSNQQRRNSQSKNMPNRIPPEQRHHKTEDVMYPHQNKTTKTPGRIKR